MLPVFSDPTMAAHDPRGPDQPARLTMALDALEGLEGIEIRAVSPATRDELVRVHQEAYVDRLLASAGTPMALDPDTNTSERSIDAALLAAGAARDAVNAVLDGPERRAFALVRPPGHHALAGTSMGFCLFNNVVVGAAAAKARGVQRVLIVDWDVHHGNGTEALAADEPDWLFFSTHQAGMGFYPGTGLTSRGNALNVPLPAGAGDGQLLASFREVLRPAAAAFEPELVLVSAGFDAHLADPLASLRATTEGYAALCREVIGLADAHADGRLVLVLEGGYDLDALASCVVACAKTLR